MNVAFSKRLNNRYFKDRRNGFFIEAGALNGVAQSVCKWFEDSLGWSGINIEPHPEAFKVLVTKRPKTINLNYALSSSCGSMELVVPHYSGKETRGNGSVFVDTIDNFKVVTSIYKVETKTYTDIINENNVKSVDLFVLDVEGYELDVARDFCNSSVLPTVLVVEINKLDVEQLTQLLNSLGYKLDWSDKNDAYFIRGV